MGALCIHFTFMSRSEKFRALIRLALADNRFEASEKKFIQALAKKLDVSSSELNQLLKEEKGNADYTPDIGNLSQESKVKFLAVLVKLMKIDGEVFLSEIRFCEKMAESMGFKPEIIGYLTEKVDQNPKINPDWNLILHNLDKYEPKSV